MMISLCTHLLDAMAEARDADTALRLADTCRRLIAGPGIFSIQQNVTTAADPRNEVRLQRYYSSQAGTWPVAGRKRKTHTRWTDTLFMRGEPMLSEGVEALRAHFDDHEELRPFGIRAGLNLPVMKGGQCIATFNVFATAARWEAQQVLALRLLALATAPWIPPAPNLSYVFDTPLPHPAHAD